MSTKQDFLNRARALTSELEDELIKPRTFSKEVERFAVREAIHMLKRVEEHLQSYLQTSKYRGE